MFEIRVGVGIRFSLVACAFCYLGGAMDEPTEQRARITRFQQFAIIVAGLMMLATGVATLVAGPMFNPYFPAGALFAPFALAGGALVIALAIRLGKRS